MSVCLSLLPFLPLSLLSPCHFPFFFYYFLLISFPSPFFISFFPNGKDTTLRQGNIGHHLFTVAYISVGEAHSFKCEYCNYFINVIGDL